MLSKIKNLLPAIAVLIISSLLFLTRLGSNSLADWDEAWYADASRFMFRSGHFLTPIWNGQYFFDKPPLQYWLTQPFLYLFGETELAYRLPSALAAIALVLIVYRWSGFPAAIILLSFPHFLDRGRSGNFDALFIFFTTFSMFLMVKNRPALGGIFLGLSWLTKGVFSGLFPLAVFFLISMKSFALKRLSKLANLRVRPLPSEATPSVARGLPRVPTQSGRVGDGERANFANETANAKLKSLLLYIFFAVLIYAPWHLLEYTRFNHLINQSYFASFDQGEFGGWSWMDIAWRFDLRYLVFLWTFLRWWFPILLISLVYQFGKFAKLLTSQQSFANFQTRFVPLISFSVIFLALSAAKTKNDWYITPAYPFIALMIADLFNQITSFAPKLLSKLANLRARLLPPEATPSVARGLPRPRRKSGEWVTANEQISANEIAGAKLVMTLVIISISVSNLYLYRRQAFPLDLWLPEKELGLTVKNLTGPSDLVVTGEYEFPTLRYYSERQVRTAARQSDYESKYWWIWDNADIAAALRRGQNIVVVHRPGTEWPIDVYGYHREKLGESNHRIISRILPNTPP